MYNTSTTKMITYKPTTTIDMDVTAKRAASELSKTLTQITNELMTTGNLPTFVSKSILLDTYMQEDVLIYQFLIPLLDRESFSVSIVGDSLEMKYRVKNIRTQDLSEEFTYTKQLPSGKRLSTAKTAQVEYTDGVLVLKLPLDVQVVKLSLN